MKVAAAIDAETAWKALLLARDRWRLGNPTEPIRLSENAATLLELSPDRTWQSFGKAVQADAALLLNRYLPLLAPQLVIGQLGQSLDGRIATANGHSHYVTGPESLLHLHRLRALVDAVVVGAGTVLADDPQLTVRHCPGPNPLRVVLDPLRKLPPHRRLFCDGQAPTLVLAAVLAAVPVPAAVPAPVPVPATASAPIPAPAANRAETALLSVADDGSGFAPAEVLSLLAACGAHRILVEGGGITVSRFLAAGALDRLHVVVAPMLIGSGRPGLSLPAIDHLDQALRPAHRRESLGEDVLYELQLR
jgi:diaminohydroxyphosphoribosylaminopyrimidine deaminase / 5-amino-6-(5-phosphoribosylamino)uracil reductase